MHINQSLTTAQQCIIMVNYKYNLFKTLPNMLPNNGNRRRFVNNSIKRLSCSQTLKHLEPLHTRLQNTAIPIGSPSEMGTPPDEQLTQ